MMLCALLILQVGGVGTNSDPRKSGTKVEKNSGLEITGDHKARGSGLDIMNKLKGDEAQIKGKETVLEGGSRYTFEEQVSREKKQATKAEEADNIMRYAVSSSGRATIEDEEDPNEPPGDEPKMYDPIVIEMKRTHHSHSPPSSNDDPSEENQTVFEFYGDSPAPDTLASWIEQQTGLPERLAAVQVKLSLSQFTTFVQTIGVEVEDSSNPASFLETDAAVNVGEEDNHLFPKTEARITPQQIRDIGNLGNPGLQDALSAANLVVADDGLGLVLAGVTETGMKTESTLSQILFPAAPEYVLTLVPTKALEYVGKSVLRAMVIRQLDDGFVTMFEPLVAKAEKNLVEESVGIVKEKVEKAEAEREARLRAKGQTPAQTGKLEPAEAVIQPHLESLKAGYSPEEVKTRAGRLTDEEIVSFVEKDSSLMDTLHRVFSDGQNHVKLPQDVVTRFVAKAVDNFKVEDTDWWIQFSLGMAPQVGVDLQHTGFAPNNFGANHSVVATMQQEKNAKGRHEVEVKRDGQIPDWATDAPPKPSAAPTPPTLGDMEIPRRVEVTAAGGTNGPVMLPQAHTV